MLEQRNSKKQGDVGMGIAIAYFTVQGYTVCIPLTDSQSYDLVVDFDRKLQRVQVKTTYCLSRYNRYKVDLRTTGDRTGTFKKFDIENIDYLFVVTETNQQYLIPTSMLRGTSSIELGSYYNQFQIN
jgi:hypothetical protein